MGVRGPKRVKLNDSDRLVIVDALSKGMGRAMACRLVGCSTDVLRTRLHEDVAFKREVLDAENQSHEGALYEMHKLLQTEDQLAIIKVHATKVILQQRNHLTELRRKHMLQKMGRSSGKKLAAMMPRIADLLLKWVPEPEWVKMLAEFDTMIRELEAADDPTHDEKD